jgi:hypothetical protein
MSFWWYFAKIEYLTNFLHPARTNLMTKPNGASDLPKGCGTQRDNISPRSYQAPSSVGPQLNGQDHSKERKTLQFLALEIGAYTKLT